MAKKKQSKKHKFKYAGPTAPGEPSVVQTESGGVAGAPAVVSRGATPARAVPGARDFSYVGGDLRRIAVLAVSLVALELVLWYLFTHTGVGNTVYTFVKV